jgi:hypothetical protein
VDVLWVGREAIGGDQQGASASGFLCGLAFKWLPLLHNPSGTWSAEFGVSMSKLMQMKKDDGALTPEGSVAVRFARKLARYPTSMTSEDYGKLRKEFGEQGALDTLLQTCMFSGFNRFTDGLRLPSEDAAVQNYNEVYGVASK